MHGRHTEVSEKLPNALGAAPRGCVTAGEGAALRRCGPVALRDVTCVRTARVWVKGAKSSCNCLLTFRDNLLVPSSGVENSKESLLSQYGVYEGKSVVWLFTP